MKGYALIPPPQHWPVVWEEALSLRHGDLEDYVFFTENDLILYRQGLPYFSARTCYESVLNNQHAFILKVIERKGKLPKSFVDGTAGWGREALTVALAGVPVTAIEQCALPVLFLHYATEFIFPMVNLSIIHKNFLTYAGENTMQHVPCLYLDPLFFNSKASLSKKAMELLYDLPESLQTSQVEQDLCLKQALTHFKIDTLVIKQYRQAKPWLAHKSVVYSEKLTKTCRYDIFYINQKFIEMSLFKLQ